MSHLRLPSLTDRGPAMKDVGQEKVGWLAKKQRYVVLKVGEGGCDNLWTEEPKNPKILRNVLHG